MRFEFKNRFFNQLVTVSLAGALLGGCGDDTPPRRGVKPVNMTSGQLSEVNDLANNSPAAAAVAAQTETENGRAPGACLEILLMDGKDVYVDVASETGVERMRDALCSLDDKEVVHLLEESHGRKGTRSDKAGLLIDSLTQYGKNKLGLNYDQARSDEYTHEMATMDAEKIRHVYCEDKSADLFKATAVESFRSVASAVTLDKYNSCVRARSYGLRCEATRHDKQVVATVRWEPTELVRSHLPRVALDWNGLGNLKAASELPRTLGIGSGLGVTFEVADPSHGAVFAVTATDRGGTYSFACKAAVDVPPLAPKLTRVGRFPQCGVELYKEGQGEECGVAEFKNMRSEACGVESYRSARTAACGVESYNSRHDCGICGQPTPWSACNKCESPAFGVARYKECRMEANGVEAYAACRHVTHGAESYKTCRHERFGVETFKECELPVSPATH